MRAVPFLAVASLIALASPSLASDKIKLDVTRAELQVIGQGLMELPYKTSAPVLSDLQGQLAKADATAKGAAGAKAHTGPTP